MKNYSFRNGTPADIPLLAKLGLASYGQYQDVLPAEGWKKMAAGCGDENTYKELLRTAQCFVCEEKNQIIGMAFIIPKGNPVAFFQADWAYIRLVGVAPGYEGKGIGRRLTQLCIDHAKKAGEEILVLHTSEFQNAARHIYESMGFVKLKELDPFYGKRYWLYTLDLKKEWEITYHRATLSDLEVLIELRMQFTTLLTGITAEERVTELKTQLRWYFTSILTDNTGIWVVAKYGSEPVGTGGILLRQNPPNFVNPGGSMGYYVNIYTIPAFRRRGICRKVMDLLQEEAKGMGIRAFELHATKEGEPVYERQGFEIHNEPTYRKYLK